MAYPKELLRREVQRWGRREIPRHGETRDARSPVRSLDSEDEHARDNLALFYDQSLQLIPGIDGPPPIGGASLNHQWPGNSGYASMPGL